MTQVNLSDESVQSRPVVAPPPPPVAIGSKRPPMRSTSPSITIRQLVKDAYAKQASDIHLRVGEPARYRIRGQMIRQSQPAITPEMFEHFLVEVLTPEQRDRFQAEKELDTAIYYPGFLRCRVNCFESLTGGAIVLRLISLEVPTIDRLGLPSVLKHLVSHQQGLILVTGPTGSGKSTSIAAMIRHLNETDQRHIVTIEDPIEYVHTSQNCLISQREVGLHTHEFQQALRAVLREDPDVILIGEMRDRTTIDTALKAAQTGHLVLGTLHTKGAISTINRLLNIYSPDEQPAMRIQILESLISVVSQQLLPTTDGRRTAVHEILINTPAMQDYLLKGSETDAFQLMETDANEGMQVMNQALCELILLGRITPEDAVKASPDMGDLRRRVRNEGYDPGRSSNREFDPSARDYRPS
ncbi:type IV pilus twitching motility protein PilT [Leptolyngbya sp. NIES-2104]|uniref:type IV pilus twitching motility protein PilT n=1 Tax=Leptolyngbya sp. NIES-2104 TaxID=1552121 RepID=UPI0006EC879C|nr:PilT/PilU family type 4a pilus ATPase [Leptolyngbya sp. NIES-2104]GAP97018.1 twitching motility protein PilT [Leptolyngbya sp. NIES-2104]